MKSFKFDSFVSELFCMFVLGENLTFRELPTFIAGGILTKILTFDQKIEK